MAKVQLYAPALITAGADDFGDTEYFGVGELVSVPSECERVSGGYAGPILVLQETRQKVASLIFWALSGRSEASR